MNAWGYVIIIVVSICVFAGLSVYRNKLMKKLSKLLYVDNKPQEFLDQINGFWGKVFFSKSIRQFQSLDAYILLQNYDSAEQMMHDLEGQKLSYGSKINLYEKETQYYIQNGNYEEGRKSNATLQELGKQISDPRMDSILDECNTLVKVYADKDGSQAHHLVEKGDAVEQKSMKGLYYYQAAKCYWYQKDKANTDKYLKKAQLNLCGSDTWDKHIDKCMHDYSALDER